MPPLPWFPSESAREAALFEYAITRMQHGLTCYGLVPPSREAVLDRARTTALPAAGVAMYVWAHHKLPEPGYGF